MSFILSISNYRPMIWMLNGKSWNDEISEIHKRALRVLLDDYWSTFEELLQKRGDHAIHTRNVQELILKVYKCFTSSPPSFLWDLFGRRLINYNLRIKDFIHLRNARTLRYGNNSLKFRESMLWSTLSDTIKSANDYREFRNIMKD